MALMLYNYAIFKGYDVSDKGDLSSFKDKNKISSWSKEAFEWAVGTGLIQGKGNSILDPQGLATREETAKLIMYFNEYLAN